MKNYKVEIHHDANPTWTTFRIVRAASEDAAIDKAIRILVENIADNGWCVGAVRPA